jgi:hypothetical protein
LDTARRDGGIDVGGFLGGALTNELDDAKKALSTSVVSSGDTNTGAQQKHNGTRGSAKHVYWVKYRLREEQKVYMRYVLSDRAFVEFAEAKKVEHSPHPCIRSFKEIMDSQLLPMVIANGRTMEIGPNIVSAVRRGPKVGKYLGLIPLISTLDVERDVTGRAALKVQLRCNMGMKPDHRAAAQDVMLGEASLLFSRNTLQKVNWPCDTVLALDSLYDTHIDEVVATMYRCGASMLVGSMVNIHDAARDYWYGISSSGRVGRTEMLWDTNLETDEIQFRMDRSATRPYSHSLSKLASYFRNEQRVFLVEGTTYVFRVLPVTNEVYYAFVIVKVDATANESDAVCSYTFRGNEREVKIDTVAVDLRFPKGSPHRFQPVSMYVGADSFSRVLQERMIKGKMKLDEIIRFTRTNRVNVVHNGVRVSCENPVSMDHLRWFCVAMDQLGDQLERTALRDLEYVQRHVHSGGWVTENQVVMARPGLARSMWAQLVSTMAEVVPVTVSSTQDVGRLEGGVKQLSSARIKCVEIREIKKVLEGGRGILDADERTACAAWLRYVEETAVCDCRSCTVRLPQGCDEKPENWDQDTDDEFEEDVFYDISDDSSESGGSGAQFSSEGFEGPEVTDIGPAPVVDGVARLAAVEYLEILDGQVDAKEAQARKNCDRMLRSGGITLDNLASLATERVKHYGVSVGRMGLVQGILGRMNISDLSHVYDPVRRVFYEAEKDSDGRVWLDSAASNMCYTNDDLSFWIYPQVVSTVQTVLSDPEFGRLPKRIPFVNGIWV